MSNAGTDALRPKRIGESARYRIFGTIGVGGMGSVHIGRLMSSADFARTVAIKRPLPELLRDPGFKASVRREARIASRVHHPNAVATLDVVDEGDELWVIMDYVHGASLAALMRLAQERGERIPQAIAVAWVCDALRGLEAVHAARDERGRPLGIIHRDVSPHNILCGVDGMARMADFGLARAEALTSITQSARFKGKLAYASPEQADLKPVTPASDLYSMGVVLWEVITGRRLYPGVTPTEVLAQLLAARVPPPSSIHPGISAQLDTLTLTALARRPEDRFASASEMLNALKSAVPVASVESAAGWLQAFARELLLERDELLMDAERQTTESRRNAEQVSSATAPPLPSAAPDTRSGALAGSLPLPSPAAAQPGSASDARDLRAAAASPSIAAVKRLVLALPSVAVGAGLAWVAGGALFSRLSPEPREPTESATPGTSPLQAMETAITTPSPIAPEPPDVARPALLPAPAGGGSEARWLSEPGTANGVVEPAAALGIAARPAALGIAERARPAPNVARPAAHAASTARASRRSPQLAAAVPAADAGPKPAPATRTRARSHVAPAPSRACEPPYSIDADGIRHMKPGCE